MHCEENQEAKNLVSQYFMFNLCRGPEKDVHWFLILQCQASSHRSRSGSQLICYVIKRWPIITCNVIYGITIPCNFETATVHCFLHLLLFTVQCSLFTVHCSLIAVHYSTVYCSPFTIYHWLFPDAVCRFIVHCSFFTVHCSMFTDPCSLSIIHCSLFIIHCLLFTILHLHCSMTTVHCSMVMCWPGGDGPQDLVRPLQGGEQDEQGPADVHQQSQEIRWVL